MSEIDWHKIHSKLQGTCTTCGGELPNHKGVCPVEGQQLLARLEQIDNSVKHVGDIAEDLIKSYKKMKRSFKNKNV
tara:strand:+ start:24975 stop:25202 length:228 start_codon:yes stop_codon:yes gene_type:complete